MAKRTGSVVREAPARATGARRRRIGLLALGALGAAGSAGAWASSRVEPRAADLDKECCHTPGSRASALGLEGGAPPVERPEARPSGKGPELPADVSRWPPKPWPPGMVWIPAGTFSMGGVGPEAQPDELPVHRVRVDGFWMDRTEVTNGQFRAFVQATGYVTTAERKPAWDDLKRQLPPGTPRPDEAVLQPGSMVFVQPAGPVRLDDATRWWRWVQGASHLRPRGPRSEPPGDDHPVVHVSWFDAQAYAAWAGKRLPTEAEWEYAARGGKEGLRFAWGDDPPSDERPRANLWQGRFPDDPRLTDGFLFTAPVASFPVNEYGLYDMIGNVWEWCQDHYRPDAYRQGSAGGVASNPTGPPSSFDPDEPFSPKRVTRGGSFLCNPVSCARYRPSARMRTSPDTGQSHLGFRTVMTQPMWEARQRQAR
jgi:sulfatase modifying factor 1